MCSDQEAVDLIRDIHDPQDASKVLVDHALSRFSTDNLSCMVVRFTHVDEKNSSEISNTSGVSETDKVLAQAQKEARKSSVSDSDKGLKEGDGNAQAEANATQPGQDSRPEIVLPEDSKTGGTLSSTPIKELASAPDKADTKNIE